MRSDRTGQGARDDDALEQLASAIEGRSPGFAGRLREIAPLLRDELSAELVTTWIDGVRRMAALEGPGREAGLALLALGPADLAAMGPSVLAAWCAAAEAIGRSSTRAAAAFAASSIRVLPAAGAGREDALAGAAAAIARLAERHASDPVVHRFAAASASALGRRGPAVIDAWAALCEATAFGGRRPTDVASRLPEAPGVADAHLAAALSLAARLAPRDRDRALRVAAELPAELPGVPAAARSDVLELLALLESSAEALLDVVSVVGPVLRRVPRRARWMVLDLARSVARRLPGATPRYLRTVLRVGEAVGFGADLEAFVDKGLALAEVQPAAALAFFALESRGARAFLRRHDVAALLDDVESTLRGYLHLITGARPAIEASGAGGLFPPVSLEETSVPVSARAEVFPTWEENFTLQKLQATLGVLWSELGTRNFALGRWLGDDSTGGLPELFRRFAQPEVAAGLLVHLEALRAAPLLARLYPGLAADVAQLRARVFPGDRPRAGHGAPEAILYLALGGDLTALELDDRSAREGGAAAQGAIERHATADLEHRAPWRAPLAELAAAARRGTATVEQSASLMALLCEQLEAGELIPVYGMESFFEDDPTLSYLLDPEGDERPGPGDDGAPGPQASADSPQGEGRRSDETSPGTSLDPQMLRAYLEQRPDLVVMRAEGPIDATGLFVSGLTGGGGAHERDSSRNASLSRESALALARHGHKARGVFLHDEWDYVIGDYRHQWCRVLEIALEGDDGEFFAGTLQRCSDMLPEVRRQFQRVKPEGYRVIHGLLDGEDFDLDAVVTARSDLRARCSPSPKLYTARQREERDVATLFLLDMSASTDEETEPAEAPDPAGEADGFVAVRGGLPGPGATASGSGAGASRPGRTAGAAPHDGSSGAARAARGAGSAARGSAPGKRPRRIIDIQKEALVIMAQALEEIGDLYAIYGFSGHGRDCVEFFDVKSFDEPLTQAVRARIGAIEPQRSTRMGAALRQAITKLRSVASRAKHLILLSDGFPQDFDYGEDRRSNVYGLRDTAMALREAQQAGVRPFCITVDRAGHDYLREMCEASRYLVIDDLAALPRELPKIYSEATRDA